MRILIIGGGIAGICIAHQLSKRGVEFKLVDSPNKPSSTSIATGMYNPIVFRHINLSWMIEELEPVFLDFYQKQERIFNTKFIQEITFKKKIPNEQYLALWNQKAKQDEFHAYIDPSDGEYGTVKRAGIIDLHALQTQYLDRLSSRNQLIPTKFDDSELKIDSDSIQYQGETYDRVILTRGYAEANSELFGWLPFNICKGEWMKVQSKPNLTDGDTINLITNIIPQTVNVYKLSSTYSWKNLNWDPSEEAQDQLIGSFQKHSDAEFEIVEHAAGLRPTVADRRPYLGSHPKFKNIFIFNGLGSKGVMLAPYFSNHLINHMLDGETLLEEVNINRHLKRFQRYEEDQKS